MNSEPGDKLDWWLTWAMRLVVGWMAGILLLFGLAFLCFLVVVGIFVFG